MSSRRGIQAAVADLVDEAVEQVQRVVGPGPGLGVVLDGGARHVAQRQPLDGAVVEVDVGQLGGAEVGLPADRLSWSMVRAPSGPSTAKPWFWLVISVRPVVRSLTGWLAPWWPNASL